MRKPIKIFKYDKHEKTQLNKNEPWSYIYDAKYKSISFLHDFYQSFLSNTNND